MRFGSVCSGIEAVSVAWNPLGWEAAWLAEIEPFPSAVLAHHYPDVFNLGDMTKIVVMVDAGEVEASDLFCGGCPCQSFSVAGLRKSLGDDRGNLTLEFIRIADAIDRVRRNTGKPPVWVFYENVPGILNTKDNAFGSFLGGLCGDESAINAPEAGWPSAGVVAGPSRVVAWRTLDAQFFGVAQRRKRVFVLALGGSGKWACADALLPISNSLQGHPAPRREAGKAAPTIPSRSTAGGGLGTDFDLDGELVMPTMDQRAGRSGANSFATSGGLIPVAGTLCVATGQAGAEIGADMAPTLNCNHEAPYAVYVPQVAATMVARSSRGGGQTNSPGYQADGEVIAYRTAGDGAVYQEGDVIAPLTTGTDSSANILTHAPAIAFDSRMRGAEPAVGREERPPQTMVERTGAIDATKPWNVATAMAVRRLTPRECERLQGFPDDYTAIPHRNKPAADGPRYKALGNSWAVPNVRWIGERIQAVALIKIDQIATKLVAETEAA